MGLGVLTVPSLGDFSNSLEEPARLRTDEWDGGGGGVPAGM